MKQLLLLAAAATLAGAVSAQSVVVVPSGSATTADKQYDSYLCTRPTYLPLHIQYIYDSADFTKPAGAVTQIAFRRNNYYGNSMPAGSITCTVKIGYSTNPANTPSTTFANNILIPAPTTFFTGTVNWPTAPKGTGPAPFTHVIKPPAPTVFLPGAATTKSVCFDMVTTASTYANSTYTIDSYADPAGNRVSNTSAQSSCKFSNNNYNNSIGYSTSGLTSKGGTWYVRYSNILPNAVGLGTISFFGVKKPGTWPLPIDLTPLGAPGCTWNVGLELGFWVPLTANASGQAAWPNITIPPGLGGVSFYDHAFFLDKAANKAGLVVAWSSEWQIAGGKGPIASTVYQTADTGSSPTGRILGNHEATIMQITY